MCGRYLIEDEKDIEEISKILQAINEKYYGTGITAKTGEIFPENNAPILSLVDNKPSLSIMKWGFPKWDGKGVIINARSETAAEKKMFAKPLIENRCVILSSGFYEWKRTSGTEKKDKYLFTSNENPMLYMAGFSNSFKTGEQIPESFVILTRQANRYISDIHDRMPVILHKNELLSWINDEKFIQYVFRRDSIALDKSIC